MRQHVARPQTLNNFFAARRGEIQVRHDRQRQFLGDLQCDIQRTNAAAAAGETSYPHLDTDDQVTMFLGGLETCTRIEQPHVTTFTNHDVLAEGKYPGKRNVDEQQHPRLRRFDHMTPQTQQIGRAGSSRVDECRAAAPPRDPIRIDTDGGASPIDVRVQVDQTRRHQSAGDVPHVVSGAHKRFANCRHSTRRKRHIHNGVQFL